ncbi:hypothetical protein D3C80_1030680 [compost metagenome]
MQLADHIAQGGHVHLVGAVAGLQCFSQQGGFLPQLLLLCRFQLEQLADAGALGHQDEPWVVGILAQQQLAQRKLPQHQGILLQTRIQDEHGISPSGKNNPLSSGKQACKDTLHIPGNTALLFAPK